MNYHNTKQQMDKKELRKLRKKLYSKYDDVAKLYKERTNKEIAKSSITRVLKGEWNNHELLNVAIEVAEEAKI